MSDLSTHVQALIPSARPYPGITYDENAEARQEAVQKAVLLLSSGKVAALQVVHHEPRWNAESEDPEPLEDEFEDEDAFEEAREEWGERWKDDAMEDILPDEVTLSYNVVAFESEEEARGALENDVKSVFTPNNNSWMNEHREDEESGVWSAFDYDSYNPRGWHSFVRILLP